MQTEKSLNIGVINPYALAEVVLEKPIRWDQVTNPEEILESTLQTPFERLFDPKNDSPLYAGLKLEKDHSMRRLEGKEALDSIEKLAVPGAKVSRSLEATFRLDPERVRKALRGIVSPATKEGWQPPNTDWVDMGDFFEEAVEPGDPIQGALGDCYFIAALSAVAWARPYVIAHRNRRTGTDQQAFVDMVEFRPEGAPVPVEVTERVPVTTGVHRFKFAKSSESGEIWPAVYEKAFAKWKTGAKHDHPEYPRIAGGDPVRACGDLIGGVCSYFETKKLTVDELWGHVRKHARGKRTFDPMVAWTYASSGAAPDKDVDYAKLGLVANHAYTVLGWELQNNLKYVVLRNPWGTHVPTQHVLAGTWQAWDISYQRPTSLNRNGIFALEAPIFKKAFAGLGFAVDK